MNYNNIGIIILLIIVAMLVFYSKNRELFTNVGESVTTYKGPGILEPGPLQSLNMSDIQSSFPYTTKLNNTGNMDPGEISLIKSDGVILGGYRPQIIRPFDTVTANPTKGSDCKWPCYSDRKYQTWCSEKNAVKYYAMRPIITSEQYENNLKKMFKKIIDVNAKVPYDDLFQEIELAVFCKENQDSLMSWLMQKIAAAVEKMPEMKRNGSWETERFYSINIQMYQYLKGSDLYIKALFDLYNPLRSTASRVVATIFMQKENINMNMNPKLINMEFVNEGEMSDYTEPINGYGPINGQNLPSTNKQGRVGIDEFVPLGVENTPEGYKKWTKELMENPNEFDWNYQNTLEVQKFNNKGFYSNIKEDNINIEGGIPDSIKKVLKDSNNLCNNNQLMSCEIPRFTGIDKSGNPVSINGNTKDVSNNPMVTYDLKDKITGRPIETPNGVIYL